MIPLKFGTHVNVLRKGAKVMWKVALSLTKTSALP